MEGSTPSGELIAKKIGSSRYGRLGPLARPAGQRPITPDSLRGTGSDAAWAGPGLDAVQKPPLPVAPSVDRWSIGAAVA
jgi:hypothetical protein